MEITPPIEPRLDRGRASTFLAEHGYRVAPSTLAKLACLGGGPVYRKFGRTPFYLPADLLSWAQSRCSGPRRSTSEPGAAA
jgi:hypothetical protein